MKLKIVSDGTPPGTKVYGVDDAGIETPVEKIVEVAWQVKVGQIAAAQITVLAPDLDVEAGQAQFTFFHPSAAQETP